MTTNSNSLQNTQPDTTRADWLRARSNRRPTFLQSAALNPPVNPRRRPALRELLGLVVFTTLFGLIALPDARADALGDALDAPGLTWTNTASGGGGLWIVDTNTTHDGVDAARSGGTPSLGSQALLETTLTGPGTLVFWGKASTQDGNYLAAMLQGISSYSIENADWHAYTFDVPAGAATLSFILWNNTPGTTNDAAWVDQVSFADYTGQPPVVVGVPPNATVGDGDNYIWWADATGDKPFSGVWQHDGTNRFEFSDVYGSHWGVGFQARPTDAGEWRLIVTNGFGATPPSSVFTLTVTSTPPHALYVYDSFYSWPDPLPLAPGAAFSLTVDGAGTLPFTYQWRKGAVDLAGKTNASLAFASFTPAQAGVYTCVVSNSLGHAESWSRTLVLSLTLPTITAQPSPASVSSGGWLHLSVAAEGPLPLAYQWFQDGQALLWDTWPDLYRLAVPEDTGSYRVRVSNANGETWSDAVAVSVDGRVPLSDALDAPLLVWSTVNGCDVSPAWFGETNVTHDGVDAVASVPLSSDQFCTRELQTEVLGPVTVGFWWKLDGAAADELRVDVLDEFLNVINSVTRTGADGADWTNITLSLSAGTNTLRWRLTSGNAFDLVLPQAWVDQVAVQSLGEALDTPALVWTTGSAGAVSGNPADGWFYQTATTSDGVDAAQTPALLAWGNSWLETIVTGPAVLQFSWASRGDPGVFDLMEFTLDGNSVTSGFIRGSPDPVKFSPNDFLIPPGPHTLRWLLYAGEQSISNTTAWLDQVQLLPGSTNLAAALDNASVAWRGPGWKEDFDGSFTGGSAAKSPAIPDNSVAALDTVVTGPAAIRFDWRVNSQTNDSLRFYVDGLMLGEITGFSGYGVQELGTAVESGVHYLRWAYEKDASGSAGADAGWVDNVRITPIGKPFITYEPADVAVTEGQPAGFAVSAISPGPMTYQWFHSGPLTGQTNDWLQLASAQLGDAGNYFVVAANSFGSTTSRVALLTVNPIPPVFTNALLPRWVYPREAVHFEVGATGPRPLTYIWQFSTNNFTTTNIVQSGSNRTYDIASAGYEHYGTWRVVALDAASGASSSTTAKLAVGSRFYHLYALTNGIPAGADAWAAGMNESTVVGRVYLGGYPNDLRAYKFNRYGATALVNLINGGLSMPNAINSAGVVVGWSQGPTGQRRAVRWRPIGCICSVSCFEWPPCGNEPPEDLGTPPGFGDTYFEAVGINDRGQIVVNANGQYNGGHYALRWQDGNWQPLQDGEWSGGDALGISSLGHIAGYSDGFDWTSFAHAWVFDPHNEPDSPSGELRATDLHDRYNLGTGGYGYSRATGVNRWGQVVGLRKPSKHTGTARAFVIERGELIDLNILYGYNGDELKVNGSGDIITYDSRMRPIVIRDDGLTGCGLGCWRGEPSYSHHRAFVLEDLVLGGIGPFDEFSHASAIGEHGNIAGTGKIPGLGLQGWRPFLLVPASAPGNHPPVAVNDTVTRFTDRVMVSASQRLLRNDTDPDPNEMLSLVDYSTGTTNGGTVFLQGDWLTYMPTNGFTGIDHFSYTITDNRGGLASATVTIRPENSRFIPPLGEIAILSEPGTIPALRFHGEAGKTYRIERTDVLGSGNWQIVAVLTAGPDGTLDTLDPGTIFRDLRYWRAVQQGP